MYPISVKFIYILITFKQYYLKTAVSQIFIGCLVNSKIIHGNPIPKGYPEFEIKETLQPSWEKFDFDKHGVGSYINSPFCEITQSFILMQNT